MDIRNAKDAERWMGFWTEAATPRRCAWLFNHAAESQETCAALAERSGRPNEAAGHRGAAEALRVSSRAMVV